MEGKARGIIPIDRLRTRLDSQVSKARFNKIGAYIGKCQVRREWRAIVGEAEDQQGHRSQSV